MEDKIKELEAVNAKQAAKIEGLESLVNELATKVNNISTATPQKTAKKATKLVTLKLGNTKLVAKYHAVKVPTENGIKKVVLADLKPKDLEAFAKNNPSVFKVAVD